jgi:hypothetical protein
LKKPARRTRAEGDAPRFRQAPPQDRQKDSTEQPSLMKPYYLTFPGDGKHRR